MGTILAKIKTIRTISLICFSVILITGKRCNEQSIFKDKCPLSYKVEWHTVEQNSNTVNEVDLLSKLSAAARADATTINTIIENGKGNDDLKSEFQLSRVLQSNTVRKASVSQDVFNEYIKIRTSSCNIWDGIKAGIYGDDEDALKRARDLFTSIQENFSRLEIDKKKEPVLIVESENMRIDTVYFSVINSFKANYELSIQEIIVTETKRASPSLNIIDVNRLQLPEVRLKGNNTSHSLLNKLFTVKIENGKSKSFYFKYKLPNIEKPYKDLEVKLTILYLSPFHNKIKSIDARIF